MDSCFGLCCKFEGVPEHVVLVNNTIRNARGGRQYTQTKESAKLKLKDQLKTAAPKLTVDKVYEAKGGILKAAGVVDLTRVSNKPTILNEQTS